MSPSFGQQWKYNFNHTPSWKIKLDSWIEMLQSCAGDVVVIYCSNGAVVSRYNPLQSQVVTLLQKNSHPDFPSKQNSTNSLGISLGTVYQNIDHTRPSDIILTESCFSVGVIYRSLTLGYAFIKTGCLLSGTLFPVCVVSPSPSSPRVRIQRYWGLYRG